MNDSKSPKRLKRIVNKVANTAEDGITEGSQKIISVLIDDAVAWIMSAYEKLKRNQSLKPKYKELQKYIEANNQTIQIGMDKKEIAVMWAMRKLGYTEEKTKEVLDLANKAYLPREER